jgi:hypothetical protein
MNEPQDSQYAPPSPADALAAALGGLSNNSQNPQIAADVSSGLAGLLRSVLAHSREDHVEPEPEPEVVEPKPTPPPRLRHASLEADEDAPEPIATKAVAFHSRTLSASQLTTLLRGLNRVEPRPGEEGLPHAVLFLKLTGADPRFELALMEATSQQLQEALRGGDVVELVEQIGIALFCGGLFFPGDVEVLGSRIRRRTLERLAGVLDGIDFSIVMAGALGQPDEDPIDLLHRAVTTHDRSVAEGRHDIMVDYGDNKLARLL